MDNLTFTTRVIDNLEWQVDLPEPMPWNHAVEYARMMDKAWNGFPAPNGNWRLPTVQELVGLWDYDTGRCVAFPDVIGCFWSVSGVAHIDEDGEVRTDAAWIMDFDDGRIDYYATDAYFHVRLVRTIKEQHP